MRSLRFKILSLVAAFGFAMAVLLATILFGSVRGYYMDLTHEKTSSFAERILEMHPNLWEAFLSNPSAFGERLREFVLYSPNTGLYLLDVDGRVLASAGENRIDQSTRIIDLEPLLQAMQIDPDAPLMGFDPDREGERCLVATRPVMYGDQHAGWLFVVARASDPDNIAPGLLRSYAVRSAVTVSLFTLAIGVLLTISMIALLTRPLGALTRAVENVRKSGFSGELAAVTIPNIHRDDEIGQLGRTFRDTFERLRTEMQRVQQTDARRREMIASVSHDLRTPLTALIGQLETIRLKADALSGEDQQALFTRAARNAEQLKKLTDALAELALLDSPDFQAHPEPAAVGELIDDIVARFTTRANAAGITLLLDYPDHVPLARLDIELFERALANLLDNALRVTPKGGTVNVRLLSQAGRLRLEVSDTGPGVALEDQARVFDRFYQGNRQRDQRGSAGLG
ncbi:MAG: ATP-binding protein, partial [Quisquiliibacterium sp.]